MQKDALEIDNVCCGGAVLLQVQKIEVAIVIVDDGCTIRQLACHDVIGGECSCSWRRRVHGDGVVTAIADLGLGLYAKLRAAPGNLCLSPYSIWSAIALLHSWNTSSRLPAYGPTPSGPPM